MQILFSNIFAGLQGSNEIYGIFRQVCIRSKHDECNNSQTNAFFRWRVEVSTLVARK